MPACRSGTNDLQYSRSSPAFRRKFCTSDFAFSGLGAGTRLLAHTLISAISPNRLNIAPIHLNDIHQRQTLAPLAIVVGIFAVLSASLPCFAQTPSSGAVIPPANPNLIFVGRWDRSNPSVYRSHWIGGYVRAAFTGTTIRINVANSVDLVASIDGEPPRVVHAEAGLSALTLQPLAPGVHTVMAAAKGGAGLAFKGFELDPDAELKPAKPRPIIECIGDSISCGSPGKIEAAGNYNWLAAEALDCDHTQIAWPARALTSGYGCERDDKRALDTQYFQLTGFPDHDQAAWDFSYTPEMILINLGQNDQCGSEPPELFKASYIRFAKHLRTKFPEAQIVALRPLSGAFAESVRDAISALAGEGDERIHFIDTTGWLESTNFIDGVHPSESGNIKLAEHLTPLLAPLLKNEPPAPKTVGDPECPAALPQAIQNAYLRGERQITITPGTYKLQPGNREAAFHLKGWSDCTIKAYGVTVIQMAPTREKLFEFEKCHNVTLAGAVLSQASPPAYQGRVATVGKDEKGNVTCEWRPSSGYPVPANAKNVLVADVLDASTRHIKLGDTDYYHAVNERAENGLFHLNTNDTSAKIETGDWLVARYGDPSTKVFLERSTDCTLEEITLMRNGFAPIFEDLGGGNHILGCHWTLGPKPEGAIDEPIVTNMADGIHCVGSNPGPDIENCTFEGFFLDDCIAIHGDYQEIKSTDGGNVLVVKNGYSQLAAGEPVRISNTRGFYAESTVVALKDNGNGSSTVTLEKALEIPDGCKLSNPLHNGGGYKIIHCQLGDTRSRGILAKGDHGLIKDNVIANCGMSAISIGPEFDANESDYCHDVIVENNTLSENSRMGFDPAIWIHGDGAIGNKEIQIVGNKLTNNYGGDIAVEWTRTSIIANNSLTPPPAWPRDERKRPAIRLNKSEDASIRGNVIENTASYDPGSLPENTAPAGAASAH